MGEMFLTVLTGLIIFIISQWILKFILEPIKDLKNVLEEIRQLGLFYQSNILKPSWGYKGNDFEKLGEYCSVLYGKLISGYTTIPFYNNLYKLFTLPHIEKLKMAATWLFAAWVTSEADGKVEDKKERLDNIFRLLNQNLGFPNRESSDENPDQGSR